MTEKLLKITGDVFRLTEKDAGEFRCAKVGPMTFTTACYDAEGLGRVSVMKGTALMGLMKMDTVVINPFDRDFPLLSYDRIHAMGNDTLIMEIYETRLDASSGLTALYSISESLDGIADSERKPSWYDPIRLGCSVGKKGKKKDSPAFDGFAEKFLREYISLARSAAPCDRSEKIKAASAYTEGLLTNGGPSTDQFVKAKGKDYTEKFFRDVLFGTGRP